MTPEQRAELRRTAATHTWVAAAELPLTAQQARTGYLRAALTIRADTKVQIVDAYCSACRRNFEACAHLDCPARTIQTTEHLRGGPIGERKKRGRQNRAPVGDLVDHLVDGVTQGCAS